MASTPIVITAPEKNTAEAWNTAVKDGAAKAGVELTAPVTATPGKKEDEPVIYESSITVNGQEIVVRDADPARVVEKLNAAISAAQAAGEGAAPGRVEESKPAFSEAELFDIGLKVQKGDVSFLEDYIDRSGALDRLLEKRGVKISDIKTQVEEGRSQKVHDGWTSATTEFMGKVKAGEIDFPGGEQNMRLMGYMIAELGLGNNPSCANLERCWDTLKERNFFFPAAAGGSKQTTTVTTKTEKRAASSTAVGTHGTAGGGERTPAIDPNRRFELDLTQLTPRQYTDAYNELIRAGVKPEQISIKQ